MDSYQLLNDKRMNSKKKKKKREAKNNSLQYYFAVMLQGTCGSQLWQLLQLIENINKELKKKKLNEVVKQQNF